MAKVYRNVDNDIHYEVFSGTDIMGVHNYFFSFALHLFLVRFPFAHWDTDDVGCTSIITDAKSVDSNFVDFDWKHA